MVVGPPKGPAVNPKTSVPMLCEAAYFGSRLEMDRERDHLNIKCALLFEFNKLEWEFGSLPLRQLKPQSLRLRTLVSAVIRFESHSLRHYRELYAEAP